jgi:GNAT superfamily N-acetyltransferase
LPVTSIGKSGIAVIVDKLSRPAHFLSLPPKFDAVDMAHLYIHEFYRHHGLPRVLISDRDVRFTSLFWTALMKRLSVSLNLSTAYHPQTDVQSERTICTLEDVIKPCLFVASKQIETNISNNWNLLTIIVNTPAQIKPRF